MIYPHEQFAIEHMGWEQGTKEPTEKQIIEAIEKHQADKKVARDKVLVKLGLTADEITTLLS
jgi:hypothetical protein